MTLAIALLIALQSVRAQDSTPTTKPASADTSFLATSSGEHLWLLTRDPKASADYPYLLRYHNTAMVGPNFTVMRRLTRKPDYLVASGNHVYFIWQRSDSAKGYEVASIQALYNDNLEVYYSMPRDRLETKQSLPAGTIHAVADHLSGPVVYMTRDEVAADDADENSQSAAGAALIQLRSAGWHDLPFPTGFDPDQKTMLASDMESGRRLLVLQSAPKGPNSSVVFIAIDTDAWSRSEVNLDLSTVRSIRRATGRAVIVQRTPTGSEYRLGFLRPDSILWFANLTSSDTNWRVVGLRNGVQLLRYSSDGKVTLAPIDPIEGKLGEAQELRPSPTKAGKVWLIAFVLAGALGVTLLVLLIRPPKEAVAPTGTEPLPVAQRMAALAIDLFPGAIIILLVTRCTIAELFQAPLITPKLVMSWEYLMLIGIMLLHTTITESLRGTTLGKAMLGAKIVAYDGSRPKLRQALLRSLGKLLSLLVLPVAVITLFSRLSQGLDDLLARTIVVHEPEEVPGTDDKKE